MISVIVLEPEIAGNIGAISRVMKNFGFNRLVLVNPRCDHLGDEARRRAKHSQDVLENAEVLDFFVADDYDYLIATTAKLGTDYNIPRSPLTPVEMTRKIKNISERKSIGIVIGREGYGMFNEEIAKCDFIVTIPATDSYGTLNISHALTVLLYELYKDVGAANILRKITPIGRSEKEQIIKMFDDVFDFMQWETVEKRETQEKLWKRIVGKAMLTKREAYGVMGLLRKVMNLQEMKNGVAVKYSSKRSKKSSKSVVERVAKKSPKGLITKGALPKRGLTKASAKKGAVPRRLAAKPIAKKSSKSSESAEKTSKGYSKPAAKKSSKGLITKGASPGND
ncbi:TrmJ/YjtD family RNA methyltransferase [Candidatus Woesearchaeota archaeon]|nr:TrmJ/YjtD family RNA methyltransferase [Candidatus Woesearchaeota archaeon]